MSGEAGRRRKTSKGGEGSVCVRWIEREEQRTGGVGESMWVRKRGGGWR